MTQKNISSVISNVTTPRYWWSIQSKIQPVSIDDDAADVDASEIDNWFSTASKQALRHPHVHLRPYAHVCTRILIAACAHMGSRARLHARTHGARMQRAQTYTHAHTHECVITHAHGTSAHVSARACTHSSTHALKHTSAHTHTHEFPRLCARPHLRACCSDDSLGNSDLRVRVMLMKPWGN